MRRPKHPDPLKQLADAKRVSQKEKLEGAFLEAWCRLPQALPMPEREHRFHPQRKWRWDFSWKSIKLAVEIQGGGQRGRHATMQGMTNDCDKLNAAMAMGWRVLKFTSKHKPQEMAEQVALVMCGLPIPHEPNARG